MTILQFINIIDDSKKVSEPFNMVYMGKEAFLSLKHEVEKELPPASSTIEKYPKLLIPAVELYGVLIMMSDAMPSKAVMFCIVDEVEIKVQKELIGWPL